MICEKDPRSDIPPVDKRKYLIPMDLVSRPACDVPAAQASTRSPATCAPRMRRDGLRVTLLLLCTQTVGQFVYVIRKRINIPSDKAIFIFVNNTLPPTAALMSTVYEQHRDEDGFMYFTYSGENTFG